MSRKLACLIILLLAAVAVADDPKPPADVQKKMDELWRRGFCLLSSVHQPAEKQAPVPKDIGNVPVLLPRTIAWTGQINCYLADGRTLWAADDQDLFRIDATTGKLTQTHQVEGVQAMASADGTLWLATRRGLVGLDTGSGKLASVDGVSLNVAWLASGPTGVYLLADTGAWRLPPGDKQWQKLPDVPGAERLDDLGKQGFWEPQRRNRMNLMVPAIFTTTEGLYAVVLNQFVWFDPAAGRWQIIGDQAWNAIPQGHAVWAITTAGVLRFDPTIEGKQTTTWESGKGPAGGRPIGLAASPESVYLISAPDYDEKAKAYSGGGVSMFRNGQWTFTHEVDGVDVRFATAVATDGTDAWVAAMLYDGVEQLGAHPGMAHVKSWKPKPAGLALLRFTGGKWALVGKAAADQTPIESRWVLGQKGTANQDDVTLHTIESLTRVGNVVWGVGRMMPKRYYSGYFETVVRAADGDAFSLQPHTGDLQMEGEHSDLMMLSHSHGHRIVLADGNPQVLGIEALGGRTWVVTQGGAFSAAAGDEKFTPAVQAERRIYWRASCAAADTDAVWFGGDAGTVSRLDRVSGRLNLVGVLPGRRVDTIAIDGNKVVVRSRKADVVLPEDMAGAPVLPDGDTIVLADGKWATGDSDAKAATPVISVQKKSNFLVRDGKRIGFVRSVFDIRVLCQDDVGGVLWLGTYNGVASVQLAK